jgi:hypothetical protein
MSEQFYSDGKSKTLTLTSGHPVEAVIIHLGPTAGLLIGTVAEAMSNTPLSPRVEKRLVGGTRLCRSFPNHRRPLAKRLH